MLIDASTIPGGTVLDCDLCIVGSGPAGLTIAHKLRDQGISIILLDSGFADFDERAQALNNGRNVAMEYLDLEACRLRMFGGSSNHWEGSCNSFDAIDFQDRPWVKHGGWPITKGDLETYYDGAHRYLQLGPNDHDLASWTRRLGLPMPDWLGGRLEGRVTHHSPPTRFGEVYGQDLDQAANVRVLMGATALEVALSDDRRAARQITVGRYGQDRIAVRAKRFVLAMGGIENARFLLLNELGNEHDQVGRYFMEHPYFRLMLLAPSPRFVASYAALSRGLDKADPHVGPSIRFSEAMLRRHEFQNCRMALEPTTRYEAAAGIESFHELTVGGKAPDETLYHIGNLLLDIDMMAEAASRRALGKRIIPAAGELSYLTVGCMAEQLPNPDSRVLLGQARDAFGQRKTELALRLTDDDRIATGRFMQAVGETFGQVGIGRVRNLVADRFAPWPPRQVNYGNHHMGTTRMSRDPKTGVVDSNLRLHSLSNLFVAGSSVFPTGGHVPPTLTIVAMSLRLADHLVQTAHG